MATTPTEERIGEAWKQHRMGNNVDAIDIFKDILSKRPDHLDALYGLGLAQRAHGSNDDAVASFNKALQLTNDALQAVEKTSNVEGQRVANDLDSYEDDRFLMLQHMISQRLEELSAE
ncbi:MAG: tetratricopeptide repeat protein [Anaerolineae bacterium]